MSQPFASPRFISLCFRRKPLDPFHNFHPFELWKLFCTSNKI
jgi:hypothetical protein